jgi:hypothetical protein
MVIGVAAHMFVRRQRLDREILCEVLQLRLQVFVGK